MPKLPRRWLIILVTLGLVAALLVVVVVLVETIQRAGQLTATDSARTLTTSPQKETPETTLKGVSLSPKTFNSGDYLNFFTLAQEAGQILTWVGAWQEFGNKKSAPYQLQKTSQDHHLLLIAITSPEEEGAAGLEKKISKLDTSAKEKYANLAAEFAKSVKPAYLGLGVEVNRIYTGSAQDFNDFSELFSQAALLVKKISPTTKVFVNFQLEQMKGLNGGLFGKENDSTQNQWGLLAKFPDADLITFTSYPGLIYKDPGEIPADYYQEIAAKTDKPVAFSEIGWSAQTEAAGWETTEEEQARFVTRFFELTGKLNPKFIVWPFVYDPAAAKPFSSVGLITKDDHQRKAWQTWISAQP